MMDFSYFQSQSAAKPELNSADQIRNETLMLKDIAEKLGCYNWQYKADFASNKGTDVNEHLGPVAQELLTIPGLAGAVIQAPDGTLAVNTNYAALAALGLVAALARIVLGETNDSSTELPGAVSDSPAFPGADTETSGNTENGEGITDGSSEPVVQSGMETEDTAGATADTNGWNGTASTTASTASSEPSDAATLTSETNAVSEE